MIGIVSFAFDDGDRSWMDAADILEEFNSRGTFYVTVGYIGTRITIVDLTSLQNRGHEIASHGFNHVSLRNCTEEIMKAELVESKKILCSYGLKIKTFACPFNSFNQRVEQYSKGVYNSVRARFGINKLPFRGRIYTTMYLVTCKEYMKTNLKRGYNLIDFALENGFWLVLYFHNIVRHPSKNCDYSYHAFKKLVEHASENSQIRTVSDVIENS